MAKCSRCGKRGLFLKVDSESHCPKCQLEIIQSAIADSQKILDEARAVAKARAEKETEQYRKQLQQQNSVLAQENARLSDENIKNKELSDKLTEEVRKLTDRSIKLKPLANSIKHFYTDFIAENPDIDVSAIESLDIENLLHEPELNCLTIKSLRSKYNSLRKQIVTLCKDYESKYTTKTNKALYKFMVLALDAALENILYKLQYGKQSTAIESIKELTSNYYNIAAEGNQTIAPSIKRFIGQIESLYIEVVNTEYEYYVQRERAKEEQRAIKEQMRQEAEERKRLEAERKKVESEEKKYQQEIDRISEQLKSATDTELEKMQKRLAELETMMKNVEQKKADIINLQNGKAGTVYIISNLGAFGDNIFKIGMTRRLEPQDRIDELGNASVPFPFDVHSFIFSQDAVGLEKKLHEIYNDKRVNKVNLRKEFFSVDIDDLKNTVEEIDPTASFKMTMSAEQYRQSLNIDHVTEATIEIDDED